MNRLSVVLLITLAFAVPGISAAQGVGDAPPGVMGPLPGGAYCNFYGIAPDGPANLTYAFVVSNMTSAKNDAVQVMAAQSPGISFTLKVLSFDVRETKFLGPADIFCSNTTCSVFICSSKFGKAPQFDSLLFLMQNGQIIAVLKPSSFTTP